MLAADIIQTVSVAVFNKWPAGLLDPMWKCLCSKRETNRDNPRAGEDKKCRTPAFGESEEWQRGNPNTENYEGCFSRHVRMIADQWVLSIITTNSPRCF